MRGTRIIGEKRKQNDNKYEIVDWGKWAEFLRDNFEFGGEDPYLAAW